MSKMSTMVSRRDQAASDGPVTHLCSQLERTGVTPMLVGREGAVPVAGAVLSIDVDSALGSELSVGRFRQQAYDVLVSGLPLSAGVAGLKPGLAAPAQFSLVCEALHAAILDAAVPADRVEIVISADALLPEEARAIRRQTLGDGVTYVLAGSTMMRPRGRSEACKRYDEFWFQLWRLRDASTVRAAYASLVTSHCSLLATECADTVLPAIGIQVPQHSAWIPLEVNLCRFANAGGSLDEAALESALRQCVALGDALHDEVAWPTAKLRHDAWLSRRLAVLLTGFGELVSMRGDDPRRFSCLQELTHLVAWAKAILRATSRSIAWQSGHVPALDSLDPMRGLLPGHSHEGWQKRWQQALDTAATRNRNLLVLSPWSVIPAMHAVDCAHFDLLPLLVLGDACAFGKPPPMRDWNINKFKLLHQRTWALLEQKERRERFAEQV